MNAEFQKIARRDKKAFLSDQCKERQTRDLFKTIRDTKGTFHEKMGSIKDRNGMDLTEAEKENNRMRKARDLFKKIRDTKGLFHVKMGTIKHRNGMDRSRRY